MTAVELGPELADELQSALPNRDLEVIVGAFEEVDIVQGPFDFVVSATAFHWVPTDEGLSKAAALLRPGGWLALWWTFFGDDGRDDPFHEAIQPLLDGRIPKGAVLRHDLVFVALGRFGPSGEAVG